MAHYQINKTRNAEENLLSIFCITPIYYFYKAPVETQVFFTLSYRKDLSGHST